MSGEKYCFQRKEKGKLKLGLNEWYAIIMNMN